MRSSKLILSWAASLVPIALPRGGYLVEGSAAPMLQLQRRCVVRGAVSAFNTTAQLADKCWRASPKSGEKTC